MGSARDVSECGSGDACADAVAGSAAGGAAGGSAVGSGRRSPAGCPARTRPRRRACRPAVGTRWFREAGGMPPISPAAAVGPLPVVRRARGDRDPARAAAAGCARSPAGSAGRRRRSRGSCAATRRPAAGGWSIGPRPRSGTPSGARGRPKVAKLAANERLRDVRAGPARRRRSHGPTASRCRARRCGGSAGGTGAAQDRRWAKAWSPEQIAQPAAGRLPR